MAGVGDRVGTSRRWKSRLPQDSAGLRAGHRLLPWTFSPALMPPPPGRRQCQRPSFRLSLRETSLFLYAAHAAYFLSIDPFVPKFCLPLFPVWSSVSLKRT